ncbi:MAG: hypothetical protein H0T69_09460 [Thermoleophilaceae bacterium]|nr:hypothetical protein [Thermoleophilaceae bacterium]
MSGEAAHLAKRDWIFWVSWVAVVAPIPYSLSRVLWAAGIPVGWLAIRAGSGLIRRDLLREVARRTEGETR